MQKVLNRTRGQELDNTIFFLRNLPLNDDYQTEYEITREEFRVNKEVSFRSEETDSMFSKLGEDTVPYRHANATNHTSDESLRVGSLVEFHGLANKSKHLII